MSELEGEDNVSNITFPSKASQHEQDQEHFQCNTVLLFILVGFYFLIFGIVELFTNFQQTNYDIPLSRQSNTFSTLTPLLSFAQGSTVSLYLYIPQHTQFDFENVDCGEEITQIGAYSESCKNGKFNQDIDKNRNILGGRLLPTNYAVPCGRFPQLYPEGSLTIVNVDTNQPVELLQTSFTLFRYDEIVNFNPVKQWANLTNQKFKSWMEPSAQLDVLKYWSVLNGRISGSYRIDLTVNNPLPDRISEIRLKFSDNKSLSGANTPLFAINFFFSCLLFAFSLLVYLFNGKKSDLQAYKLSLDLDRGDSTTAAMFKHPSEPSSL